MTDDQHTLQNDKFSKSPVKLVTLPYMGVLFQMVTDCAPCCQLTFQCVHFCFPAALLLLRFSCRFYKMTRGNESIYWSRKRNKLKCIWTSICAWFHRLSSQLMHTWHMSMRPIYRHPPLRLFICDSTAASPSCAVFCKWKREFSATQTHVHPVSIYLQLWCSNFLQNNISFITFLRVTRLFFQPLKSRWLLGHYHFLTCTEGII